MTINSSSSERRLFTRIMFDAQTRITQNNKSWDVNLVDISLNGLLVNEPENWHIDPDSELTATINLDDNTAIIMTVQQRHTEQGHVGFHCLHMDIDSISHLRKLVELNLGDLALLERELAALGR